MVPVGEWYDNRMRNLSETDRVRDESKVGSGFGKKVENWLGRDMVYPTNVLHGATECGNRQHSAVFPYWLPQWFIELFTDAGDTVLDPFAGSGTAIFAAPLLATPEPPSFQRRLESSVRRHTLRIRTPHNLWFSPLALWERARVRVREGHAGVMPNQRQLPIVPSQC